jgi:putative phage-type endonuclease
MKEEIQLEFLKDILRDLCSNIDVIYDDYASIKSHVIMTMQMVFDEVSLELIDYNISKLLNFKYEFNENFQGKIIYNRDDLEIPDEYKELVDHVEFIANIPQPEQRTKEWFDMRKNMITASCAAQAIGENPYPNQRPDDLVLEKLGLGPPFPDNKFVHHGKKYEEIATKIYENIYDVKVEEYGLVPHIAKPVVPFVGASPDGIGSRFTLSNKFSPMIGRMLEIKCPFSRKITTKGEIDGEICPHYYHCQVQQQLECCDLEYCDFWQCTLNEYSSKEEMLADETPLNYKEEQDVNLLVPKNCRQGCVIQLFPKNKITRFCLFDAKYLYPESIDMTMYEYDQWILNELTHLNQKYPDLMKNYVFDSVLYWKLTVCHNVKIKRDKEWFNSKLPLYDDLWKKITLCRSSKKELEKFVNDYNEKHKRKKDVKIEKDNDELLFVDSETSEDVTSKNDKNNKDISKKSVLFVDSDSDSDSD